jgi:hypothetical protein
MLHLVITFPTTVALANDTAFGGSGVSPMPIGQSDVEMISENIVIKGTDIGNERGEGRWEVSCDYAFRNTSDKPVKLTVGFPFPVNDEEGAVSVPRGKKAGAGDPLVYDFRVSIDGNPVNVRRAKIAPNSETGQYYRWAYLWDMEFKPHEMMKVHHDYVTGVTWDVMGYSWALYVLRTGANWKGGKIGSAHFEVIPNELVKMCSEIERQADYLKPKPRGMKVEGVGVKQKFVWDLKNFQPEEDLDICMQTAKNFALRQILFPVVMFGEVEQQLAKLSSGQLRILRNTVFARHGRVFKDSELQKYFEKQWWYVPNSNYSDALLADVDKSIVKQIAAEEKRRATK